MKNKNQNTDLEPGLEKFDPEAEIKGANIYPIETPIVEANQEKPTTIGTPSKIQQAIQMLEEYFVRQIMDGKYTIKSITQYTVEVVTETGHDFAFWIENKPRFFRCYEHKYNYIDLKFTTEQKEELHPFFRNIWDDENNRPENVAQRKELYIKLRDEFENLSN